MGIWRGGYRKEVSYLSILNNNIRQIKERDNCQLSTRKDMTEDIQIKIKQKRPVYDAMSGKQKLFPLSVLRCKSQHLYRDIAHLIHYHVCQFQNNPSHVIVD